MAPPSSANGKGASCCGSDPQLKTVVPAQDTSCGCGPSPAKPSAGGDACCGSAPAVTFYREGAWTTGEADTPAGRVPRVSGRLSMRDRLGHLLCRVSEFRMRYGVRPGLYAIGSPGAESEVFASANYKMSFDVLRRALDGIDAWILVLDTAGINVWCAAGKGTFGTDELSRRIEEHGLGRVVTHRRIIVPQLGAPGVSAHEVQRRTGFAVRYGPVRARDIPRYLEAGRKAAPEMRSVSFPLADRLVLTPMEIVPAMKKFPLVALGLLAAAGLGREGILFGRAIEDGLPLVAAALAGIGAGSFLTPALLPFIPVRSFALKGWITGLAATIALERATPLFDGASPALVAALYVTVPVMSSYLALLFTGTTTFTGMSGVKKELRAALPLYRTALVTGGILFCVHKIMEWGLL